MAIIKIIGNLVRDGEFKIVKNDMPVYNITICENVQKKINGKYEKDYANFYKLVAFKAKAEKLADQDWKKGDFVEIEFSINIKNKNIEPKDGEKYGKTIFFFENDGLIESITKKEKKAKNEQTEQQEASHHDDLNDDFFDNIPF